MEVIEGRYTANLQLGPVSRGFWRREQVCSDSELQQHSALDHVFLARVSQLQFGCRFLPCDVR
jgi:hypothetical protein